MTKALQGGCLCGKVRFRTTQSPMRTFACHCTFCQRVTGSSYYAESMFPMHAVVFNDGAFCPHCGTTVSLTFERWPEVRGISRGCYDDPNAVEVSSHIWTRSAQTGTALPEAVECFAGARATLEGRAEPSAVHTAPVMARAADLGFSGQ